MLGIQLTALNALELRRLLEVARARGQSGLARQLEAELAARPGRLAGAPTPMTPYLAPGDRSPPPTPRSRGPVVAVAGLAAVFGAALAWGVSLEMMRPAEPPLVAANSTPAARVAMALTTATPLETAPAQPIGAPATSPAPLEAETKPARNPCYDLPTARERLVCGYPTLASQDRRMTAALERVRAASGDPDAINDDQDAWRRASANIWDRQILRERYAQRIAELEAAAR